MKLTWLGRSCFQLVTPNQIRTLFDPYLELYRRQNGAPYPCPDIICASHGHLDHFADVPELVRGDSPALVVAIPRLCRALRKLIPETKHRLFPIPWDDHVEVRGVHFHAFRSPPAQISLYDMFEEVETSEVIDFLQAFRQIADEILYLPLTSFGVTANGLRLLHFVAEGEGEGERVDVGEIGVQFAPDIALVGVNPGAEEESAEYAAALGASLVIPHHYYSYGNLPAANLNTFMQKLAHLAPDATLLTPDVMETIDLNDQF